MNAAMLVQGLATGGPPEAKRLLASFWRRVADAAGSPDFGDASRVDPFEALGHDPRDAAGVPLDDAAHRQSAALRA